VVGVIPVAFEYHAPHELVFSACRIPFRVPSRWQNWQKRQKDASVGEGLEMSNHLRLRGPTHFIVEVPQVVVHETHKPDAVGFLADLKAS
jgi:hypothetical protein